MKINNKPLVIVFDCESSPNLGYFWGQTYETSIIRVVEYETIMTISYWDSKTEKIKSISQWDFKDWRKGVWNDKSLISYFREILLKYDIVVGQNSDAFDIKFFNARLAYWGFEPMPEYKTFDTKKLAKSKFKLVSYSLEYLANYFGFEGKYHHSGLDMWFKCREGDKKAQKEMTYYCNKDVEKTKNVFLKILPFCKISGEYIEIHGEILTCPNPLCLGELTKEKKRRVIGGFKQQWQCKSCHHYHTPNKLIKE